MVKQPGRAGGRHHEIQYFPKLCAIDSHTSNAILIRMFLRTVVTSLAFAASLFAQAPPSNPEWTEPFPPHRVIGNVYYVGSKDLASYLITTPQGHVLINSSLESSVPLIQQSVEKLGFRFRDIKILLISHAHFDHCAGSALIKKLTGAKYMVMDADFPTVEDGGRSDFRYGGSPEMFFKPTKVDRVLHDGDEVRLGGMLLTAHITPGHTKGCTTWTLQATENGKTYDVVIVGSPNVNPGYRLVHNSQYPQIAEDYERGFRTLKALPCDIFLGAHGSYYGMVEKFARIGKNGSNPFLDHAGYQAYVTEREQAFHTELSKQQSSAP